MVKHINNRLKRLSVNYRRFGLINTVRYLFYNGLIKRAKNRYKYLTKGKEYPQNIIFITSLPKSGSTWLANMCAEIDGFDLFAPYKWNTYIAQQWDDTRWDLSENIFSEFSRNLAVIRGHTWATPQNIKILKKSNLKYVIGVRDPRDKLISEYYHSRNFPGHWAHAEAGKLTIEKFIAKKLNSGEFEKESLEWIRLWLKARDQANSIIIRYEDLLDKPHRVLAGLFEFLYFKIDGTIINSIINKHSFRKVTGRSRGESDDAKFVRKGIAGEWKKLFSEEHKILFNKIGEDLIEALNYEPTLKNG